MRRKISTFRQGSREPFKNAWGRFKSYQLECPHHGYSEPQLINTFTGVLTYTTRPLDIVSEGNFNTRSPEDAMRRMENVATIKAFTKMDIERGNEIESADESQLAEIKEALHSIHSLLTGPNQFGPFQIDDDIPSDLEKRVESIDDLNLKDELFKSHNGSFTRNYESTVGQRRGKAKPIN